jgi:hypothetical protein
MTKPTRVRRALALLRRAFHWQKSHGHNKQAAKIARDIRSIQDNHAVKPKVLIFPGVRAAREQSENGGLPGSPHIPVPPPVHGWCLMMVRLCYGIAAKYNRAIDAWNGAERKIRFSDPQKIQRGLPVFFAPNHIAIGAGPDEIWSTDVHKPGVFSKVRASALMEMWGLTLLGQTRDLNGQQVPAEKLV